MADAAMDGHDDLIRRFTGMRASVLGYLRVLVRDPHLAKDLFQETSHVVLRTIEPFDCAGDLGACSLLTGRVTESTRLDRDAFGINRVGSVTRSGSTGMDP